MQTPIQFLDPNDFRVLKVIRIDGPEWNRFTGYLYYKRFLSKEYCSKSPDILDDSILNAIKDLYPNSLLVLNKDILFKGEYEDILKGYTGGTSIDLTIRFTPQIPYDKIHEARSRKLYEFSPRFQLNLFLGAGSDKLEHIRNFAISYVPLDKFDSFAELLKTLDLKK